MVGFELQRDVPGRRRIGGATLVSEGQAKIEANLGVVRAQGDGAAEFGGCLLQLTKLGQRDGQ